jgi:uncharacterized membrane protein YeaQ/YmgE (transglycosylase-associated protein family)
MIRIILGIIVGFVAWSILWVGSDQVLIAMLSWYGEHQHNFQNALINHEPFEPNSTILAMNIVRSIIISLIAGYVAALVAKENRRSTLILGILLFLFGLMVEMIAWRYLPLWYHFIFLFLLIPVTMAGGKLKRSE